MPASSPPPWIGRPAPEQSQIATALDETAASIAAFGPNSTAEARTKTNRGVQHSPIASAQFIEWRMSDATGRAARTHRIVHLPDSGGEINQLRSNTARVIGNSLVQHRGELPCLAWAWRSMTDWRNCAAGLP